MSGHSLGGGSYPSAEKQSVYSTADWEIFIKRLLGMYLFMHGSVNNHIYPTPPLGQDMTQGQFFSEV